MEEAAWKSSTPNQLTEVELNGYALYLYSYHIKGGLDHDGRLVPLRQLATLKITPGPSNYHLVRHRLGQRPELESV